MTGNLNDALLYLNSNGNILNAASAGARTTWTGNSVRDWTPITLAGVVVPTGPTAVFLEMTLATGQTGPAVPCGVDNQTGAPMGAHFSVCDRLRRWAAVLGAPSHPAAASLAQDRACKLLGA